MNSIDVLRIRRKASRDRVLLTACIFVIAGLILFFIAMQWPDIEPLHSILVQIGSLCLVTSSITLLWDFWGKRSFLEEILAHVKLSSEVESSGTQAIRRSFQDWIDWQGLFDSSTSARIFVAYAHSWRSANSERIRNWLEKSDKSLWITLPDPEDELVIDSLSRRFGYEKQTTIQHIQNAISFFQSLATELPQSSVHIFLTKQVPLFSYYIFDSTAICSCYHHTVGRAPVPCMQVSKPGWLFTFLSDECKSLTTESELTRRYVHAG